MWRLFPFVVAALVCLAAPAALARQGDPWYNPAARYVKVGVVEDGVYGVTGQDLLDAGVALETINPASFQLYENGVPVPLHYTGAPGTVMTPADVLAFVGRRNTGADEGWAYEETGQQSSSFYSLYTDTTYYWLTWGQGTGLRYQPAAAVPAPDTLDALPDVLHLEEDLAYYAGDPFIAGDPLYTRGEGFYWEQFVGDEEHTYEAPLPDAIPDAAAVLTLRAHLNGSASTSQWVSLSVRLEDGLGGTEYVALDTLTWVGLAFQDLEATIPQDQLPDDGLLSVRVRTSTASGDSPDLFLDYIEATYTRRLAALDGQRRFAAEAGTRAYVLTGWSAAEVTVFTPEGGRRYTLAADGGTAVLEAGAAAGWTFHAVETGAYRTPAAVVQDRPSDLENPANAADYVILTTAALQASAAEMAAYRGSPAGGGYTVMRVDVQDVFDQFDYGRATPLALRNFVRATQAWATPPRFLLLWGDALYPDRHRPRPAWEVPAFGNSASDGWFAMQTAGPDDWSESLAIGRIPVRDDAAGSLFVDKIQTYEAAPLDAWQKRALFLVGGKTESEQTSLKTHALDWSGQVAGPPTGLDTLHFFKTIDGPSDPTFKDSLQAAIATGAAWLTYFGHSASQTWEIVTDPPADFGNAGRLPVVLSLGCFTGNFATGEGTAEDLAAFSEQLVVGSLAGSIAHWGASASGTIATSALLSDEVHEGVFADTLRTLGTALREAKERFARTNTDPLSIKHLLQYGLVGDPATRLDLPVRPDLALDASDLTLDPPTPIPADSQFTVTVHARNRGLVPADSVTLRLTHMPPGAPATVYTQTLPPYALDAEAAFTLPLDDAAVGRHRLQATLDPLDAYAEEDEFNNTARLTPTVFSTDLTLLAPSASGLVTTRTPTLSVTETAPQGTPATVLFQLDTTATFSSPALLEGQARITRMVAAWQPGTLDDGRTYFWRARLSGQPGPPNWQEAAFTVRTAGAPGWLQQDPLFADNEQSDFLDYTGTAWQFKTFNLDAIVEASRPGGVSAAQFVINGEIYERLHLGFALLVLDGTTGAVKGHESGPTYVNDFEDPADVYDQLAALAATAMPGDYALVNTRHFANKTGEQAIPDSVRALFQGLGSTAIDTLTYDDLWIMIAHLGTGEPPVEIVEPAGSGLDDIVTETLLPFFFGEGTTTTPPIGPAAAWQTLDRAQTLFNTTSSVRVDVLDADGVTVLLGGLDAPGPVDLSGLDARTHPFLRLRATLADTAQATTPQLDRWEVAYAAPPEVALDPRSFTAPADTVAAGTPLAVSILARTLNGVTADTLLVHYDRLDPGGALLRLHTDTLRNVAAQAASAFTLETGGLSGDYELLLTAELPGRTELTTLNNRFAHPFTVTGGAGAARFEVWIDGEAYPDDPGPAGPMAPFVAREPTIEIRGEAPSDSVRVRLDGRPVTAVFRPAGKTTPAALQFRPELPPRDTVHTLVVEALDAAGNPVAKTRYQVHFQTQAALAIEGVYPYPNPMHTHTVFAFRLRGADASEVEDLRLRIYTLTGRLVRELDPMADPFLLRSGTLRIGWNQVTWDGRDADGDRVGTGVYLYRVFARAGGHPLGTGGVGKLAVIR